MSDATTVVYDPTLWAKAPAEFIVRTDNTGGGIRVLPGEPVALGHLSVAHLIDPDDPSTWVPLLCERPTRPGGSAQPADRYEPFGARYL